MSTQRNKRNTFALQVELYFQAVLGDAAKVIPEMKNAKFNDEIVGCLNCKLTEATLLPSKGKGEQKFRRQKTLTKRAEVFEISLAQILNHLVYIKVDDFKPSRLPLI